MEDIATMIRLDAGRYAPICSFYARQKSRASRENVAISEFGPVAAEWLVVIIVYKLLIRRTALSLVNKQE